MTVRAYQSVVHSHTLPAMSYRPNPFGGKRSDGCRAGEAVGLAVAPREVALPEVGEVATVGDRVVAPCEGT